jgi:PKD repeat protein
MLYPTLVLVLISLVFPLSAVQGSPAPNARIEPALLDRFAEGRADFVVRFAAQADLSPAFQMNWHDRGWFVYEALQATAARTQKPAIDEIKSRGLDYRSFIAGNELYVYAGDLAVAEALAGRPEVAAVAAPRTVYLDPVIATARADAPHALIWALTDIKADQFWSTLGLQGEGSVVANIDTGVQYDHPALDQAYKCAANPGDPACWYDPTGECGGAPCDPLGHGTATMGAMVADDDPTLQYQSGTAPNAQWIACKACTSGGACSDTDLNACADWILAPGGSPDNRPYVVENAWGGQGCNNWFQGKVQAWVAAGVFPSFPTGGQGPSCATMGSPADYQESFAGTAHDESRNSASFASRGPSCYGHDPYTKPNLSAPGVNICLPVNDSGWLCYSGTSFASSFPPGAVALLWSCAPQLRGQVYATFEALQNTADTPPAGGCGAPPDGEGNYTYGYGYLNILAAGLAHCAQGPGVLDGHVYDAGTGTPIVGATVTAVPGPVQDITDPQGYYSMTLDAGAYTVTAAAAGHLSATAAVVVAGGFTTTQDFSLSLPPTPPVPSFATDSPVCLGEAMRFTDTSQADPPVTAWWWAFGDGGTSDQQNPVHTYAAAGDFDVTLWVTSAGGMSWTAGLVTVLPLPQASFNYAPQNGPAPLTVYFTSTSANVITATWAFGDGGVGSGDHVSHTYAIAGTFPVTLTVQGTCGSDTATGTVAVFTPGPPVAAFSAWPGAGFAPLVVQFHDESTGEPPITSWQWTFGDSGTSTATNPLHTFGAAGSYDVLLTVASVSGTAAVSHTVVAWARPEASFDYRPARGPLPLTVYFTDTSSGAISPTWAFGDGGYGAGGQVSHTYGFTGTFTVVLTVTSAYSSAVISTATGTVAAGLPCQEVAIVTLQPEVVGCQVSFSAEVTGDPPLAWSWAFGDGVTSTLAQPVHVYPQTGRYTGTVDVWNCADGHDARAFSFSVTCAPSFQVYLPVVFKGYAP